MNLSTQNTTPPDFVGYEKLIAFMDDRALHRLEGDIVEIGAFMGGGTVKLAEYAGKHGRRVHVIDVFEPSLDDTMSPNGVTAREVYEAFLEGRSMFEVYEEATLRFDNVTTLRQDSRTVRFTNDQKFFFGFIDGCHQEAFVMNDFSVVWPHMVSGGALAFHDYEYDDWPEVTWAVKKLREQHAAQIAEIEEIEAGFGIRTVVFVKK